MFRKLLARTILATLALTLLLPVSPAQAAGAFDALAACINKETTTQVNVMFLIDSSGSLKFADDNKSPGSDPEGKRAEIIASSILLLERINQEKPIFFALTTFDSTSPGQNKEGKKYEEFPWTQANPDNVAKASKWSEKIKDFNNGQKTDWGAGLRNAKKKLLEAPSTGGEVCQAIIWFTDGGIDVGGGPADLKRSIRELCGTTPGEAGVQEESLITTIREAGIHLIGVFLKPQVINEKNRGRVSLFEPTVLGQGVIEPGDIGQGTFTCGEFPIPDSHGQGELIEVKNTDELAERFLKLTMQIIEGKPAFEDCQSGVTNFAMDPGIKDAVVLLPSLNWKISIPGGGQVSRQSLPAGWNETTQLERFSVLNVPIKKELVGKWSINSGNSSSCASVFLDAGIQPRIDKKVVLTEGNDNQEIFGSIIDSKGNPADLSAFQKVELRADLVDNTPANRSRRSSLLEISRSGSSWSGTVNPYSGSNTSSLLLLLNLTTKSGIDLPTIKVAVEVPLVLPDLLCSISKTKLKLTGLYTDTPAKGSLMVKGPKQGDCLFGIKSIEIKRDPAGRTTEMFEISVKNKSTGETISGNEELLIKQGEQVELDFEIRNGITAKGKSSGLIVFSTKNLDSSQSMKILSDLEFKSVTKPAPPPLLILLTLIGLLIPLSILQLSNFFFARFRMEDLRVANVPVKVTFADEKVFVMRLDEQQDFLEDRNFEYTHSSTGNEKTYAHDWNSREIFRLKTRLPKNPFGEVSGTLNFDSERRGFANERLINDFDGLTAAAPLNPNGYWVASALQGASSNSGGAVSLVGLVTIFLNVDAGEATRQFSQIKDEIESNIDSWRRLSEVIGSSPNGGDSGDSEASSTESTSGVEGSSTTTKDSGLSWDEFESGGSNTSSASSSSRGKEAAGKEKKSLFKRNKKEKDRKNSSSESSQSVQPDLDDPWA